MSCREAIFVDESTIDFPIFPLFFNTKFPIFPIFSILSFLFSYFLSNHAAGHPEKAVDYHARTKCGKPYRRALQKFNYYETNARKKSMLKKKKRVLKFFFTIFLNMHITSDFHDSSVWFM